MNRLLRRHSKKTVVLVAAAIIAVSLIGGGAYAAIVSRGVTYENVDLKNGLVGQWNMNGNANDTSGSGNHGTVYNAALTDDRTGKPASAYAFTGASNSYISAGTDSSLSFTNNLSLSAWIKPTAYKTAGYYGLKNEFIARGNASTYNYALQASDSTTISFIKRTGSEGLQFNNFTGVPSLTDKWTHVAVTVSGSTLRLYIDGELFATQSVGTIGPGASDPLYLGSVPGNAEMAFTGSVDEINIYDREVNGTEVRALYTGGNSTVRLGNGQSGLVGQWKLDGNAKDSTPNGINGAYGSGNAAATDRKGAAGRATSFNSTASAVINLGNPANLNLAGNMSISVWVRPTNNGNFSPLVSKGPGDYEIAADFRSGATNLAWRSSGSGTTTNFVNFFNGYVGDWVHVSVTVGGNTVTAYRDGAQFGTLTIPAMANTSASLLIGGRSSTYFFSGSMDDVRLYNRTLSAEEVTRQYNSYDSQINLNSSPTNNTIDGNINQGLVGYWPFSGNAKDATPYSNNGLVTGAILTSDRKGVANSAYSFNGSTDNIDLPGFASSVTTGDITISAWVLPAGSSSNTTAVSKWNQSSVQSGDWVLYLVNRIPRFSVYDGATQYNASSATSLTNGVWYHLAGVYDSVADVTQIYVNGSLEGFAGGSASLATNSTTARIGGRNATTVSIWEGGIDDVRVYNRALSTTEITSLYNANQ